MRKLLLVLFICLSLTGLLPAQEIPTFPYVAIVNEYDVVVNEDYSYLETYHVRIKIQDKAAINLSEWPVYYNDQREEIVEIKAFTESEQGIKQEAKEVSDAPVVPQKDRYKNFRVKVISLPNVEVGSILDVTVKSRYKLAGLPQGFWHAVAFPAIPTQLGRFTYDFPSSLPISYSSFKTSLAPKVSQTSERTKWTFTLNDTSYLENDILMPPLDDLTGIVSVSSFKDWSAMAQWYLSILDQQVVDDSTISVDTLQLVSNKLTQKEKARAIFEYIQDNFEYVPINLSDHRLIPSPTIDVYKSKYGDHHDLVVLAHQMLAIAGIDSSVALFSGEFNADAQQYLPNLSVFDHVILEVTLDGNQYFVDPVARGFDIGQLPSSYDQATVFVINANGARFQRLPSASEDINTVLSSSDIHIDPQGNAEYELLVHLPLTASVEFKQNWLNTPKDQQEAFFDRLQQNFTIMGEIVDREIIGVNDRYKPVILRFKYKAPLAYPIVNDMILLKEPMQDVLSELELIKNRKADIYFPANSVTVTSNTYHIPEGLVVDFVPEDFTLTSDVVDVSRRYSKQAQTIKAETIVRQKRSRLKPNRIEDLKIFKDQLLKAQDKYIVLKKQANIAPAAKEWINQQ